MLFDFAEEAGIDERDHGDHVDGPAEQLDDDHGAASRRGDDDRERERAGGDESADDLDEIDRSFTVDP